MSLNNELLNGPLPRKLPVQKTDQSTGLSKEQEDLLHSLYYDKKILVGRDRLHGYIMANHPESGISRRDCMRWLKLQVPWQLTKQPAKRAATSLMDIRKEGYVSVDLKGPLPRDGFFEYIFALVDVASRKTYALPIRSTSAADSRDALKKLMEENPEMKITLLRSDNGGSFQSVFSDYLKGSGIKQLYSSPHSPWQNRCERTFRTMGDMLYKNTIATNSKAWVKALPAIVEAMNATICRSIKMTTNDAQEGLPADLNE